MSSRLLGVLGAVVVLALGACSKDLVDSASRGGRHDASDRPGAKRESLLGERGLNLGGIPADDQGSGSGIAVNSFLWRASLDTIAFMPLASADPFGGVILTDWYAPPEAPDERFKVNVYILSRVLRADGLKITVFRQQRDAGGQWRDAAIGPEVSTEFENAVLTRARDLRLRAVPENN